MTDVIASHERRAAHGKHTCVYCHLPIAARERYLDLRVVDAGHCWTQRQHIACNDLMCRYGADVGLDDDEWADWDEVLAWAEHQQEER